MEQIYQSAVLQALGWAIADSIWQMALLWLVYQLCIAIPVKNNPVIRHAGATAAIFIGGIWFLGNIVYKVVQERGQVWSGNGKMDPTLMSWLESLLPYLSSAYLVVLFVLLARFIYAIMNTRRLRIAKPASASHWQAFVDEMALRFFIARKVWIQVTDMVDVPATIGFVKPIILLPFASVNHLSVAQVEAIIMHELAHIKRHDYLINLLVSFVETILFFNPFTYLLSRQIRRECELCCDDAVLGQQQDPGQYAYALLLLEKSRQQFALAMAATGTDGLLLGRVKRILKQPEQKVKYRHRLAALALVAVMIMGLSVLSPASKETTTSVVVLKSLPAEGPAQFIRSRALLPLMAESMAKESRPRLHVNNKPTEPGNNLLRSKRSLAAAAPDFSDWVIPEDLALVGPPLPPLPPKHPTAPTPGVRMAEAFRGFEAPVPMAPESPMPALREIPELPDLSSLQENELEAFVLDMNGVKIHQEKALADMANVLRANGNMHALSEGQLKRVEQEFKVMEDKVREQNMLQEKQRARQERMRVVLPGRVISNNGGKATGTSQDRKEEETVYRSYSFAPGSKARVKSFKDENGFIISIVEDDKQVRILFSGN